MEQTTKTMKHKYFRILNALGSVQRNATNPFAKSKYATLSNIQKHLAPLLEQEECFVAFDFGDLQNGIYNVGLSLCSVTTEEPMQWAFAVPMDNTQNNKVQAFGSTMTYAQRYALCIAFQIALDDEDPDSKLPQAPKQTPAAATPKAPAAPKLIPLNVGDANYAGCVAYLANTPNAKLSDLYKKYTLTEEVKTQITADALNFGEVKS